MSSKVIAPGGTETMGQPVAWRQVRMDRAHARETSEPRQPDTAALLAEARQQCEKLVAEARAEGRREGEIAGHDRGAREVQPAIRPATASSRNGPSLERIPGFF